jgi:glutaredoxin
MLIFYAKEGCQFCINLERDLKQLKIPYQRIVPSLEEIPRLKQLYIQTFPMIIVNGVCVGGYSDFLNIIKT